MDAERLSAAPSEPADLDRTGRQEPTAPRGSATAREAAALAARTSYGRLVSLLAAGNGDVISAEDALAAAFEQALRTWPETGVPRSPAAWLLTVARNRLRDQWKSAATRTSVPLTGAVHPDGTVPGALTSPAGNGDPFEWIDMDAIGDKRLELLFVCGHPAIDPAARTPLMLQTVLGFDAAQIARAFAVSPAAMAKRLVRAKRRIAVARIPFTVPDRQRLPERLAPVLEAVYGCFALGRDVDIAGPHRGEESMVGEAQYLAETLADLLQTEPEAWGLAALITLSRARMGPGESFVPLADQDPSAWDRGLIATGERHLRRVGAVEVPGRFQLEAAIQAVHCARAVTGRTDWAALATLYQALVLRAPSLGALVAQAAVQARVESAEAALRMLADLRQRTPATETFQPFHATRADLLARSGQHAGAVEAYRRASELTAAGPIRDHLLDRAVALEGGAPPPR